MFIIIKLVFFKEMFKNNYKKLRLYRLASVYFIHSHKFSTFYLIFYKNGVTQIENAGKVGIYSRDPWP